MERVVLVKDNLDTSLKAVLTPIAHGPIFPPTDAEA